MWKLLAAVFTNFYRATAYSILARYAIAGPSVCHTGDSYKNS